MSDINDTNALCKIIKLLISNGSDPNKAKCVGGWSFESPLHYVCIQRSDLKHADLACIKVLLDNGADINAKIGMIGESVLHYFLYCTKATKETRKQVIKLFIEYGFDISTASSMGQSLLFCCMNQLNYDLIETWLN